MSRHRASPERLRVARLSGSAQRYANQSGTALGAAIAELRTLANDQDEALAEAAADTLRGWLSAPSERMPSQLLAAWLLVAAIRDLQVLAKRLDGPSAAVRFHG